MLAIFVLFVAASALSTRRGIKLTQSSNDDNIPQRQRQLAVHKRSPTLGDGLAAGSSAALSNSTDALSEGAEPVLWHGHLVYEVPLLPYNTTPNASNLHLFWNATRAGPGSLAGTVEGEGTEWPESSNHSQGDGHAGQDGPAGPRRLQSISTANYVTLINSGLVRNLFHT